MAASLYRKYVPPPYRLCEVRGRTSAVCEGMANNIISVPFVNAPWYCETPRRTLSSVLHTDSQPLETRHAARKVDGPMLSTRMCAIKSCVSAEEPCWWLRLLFARPCSWCPTLRWPRRQPRRQPPPHPAVRRSGCVRRLRGGAETRAQRLGVRLGAGVREPDERGTGWEGTSRRVVSGIGTHRAIGIRRSVARRSDQPLAANKRTVRISERCRSRAVQSREIVNAI